MGSLFDNSSDVDQASLLSPEQQALMESLGPRFQELTNRDPFSVQGAADIFQQNFLGPALFVMLILWQR